ncbi:uncharacterized protein LOC126831137 isoform X2 [Patella vulgata]|uniref:uncharacterized protein LOC126831137 isoform X2 n=1 Tax=Patella vulgata TaxID=6465 RepID=UPI0021805902|nr:uncharacterized protein LOC126831137 isoform X2 [Patella vulgata]
MWRLQTILVGFALICGYTNGQALGQIRGTLLGKTGSGTVSRQLIGKLWDPSAAVQSTGTVTTTSTKQAGTTQLLDKNAVSVLLHALGYGRNGTTTGVLSSPLPNSNNRAKIETRLRNFLMGNAIPESRPNITLAATSNPIRKDLKFFQAPKDTNGILAHISPSNPMSLPPGAVGSNTRNTNTFNPMLGSQSAIGQNTGNTNTVNPMPGSAGLLLGLDSGMPQFSTMMYDMKASRMLSIMSLYEQEGCINPVTILPLKSRLFAKNALANGCRDVNADLLCSMTQVSLPGNTPATVSMQMMTYNLMAPQTRQQMATMMNSMSPNNGMLLLPRGEAGVSPEMTDHLAMTRRNIFPLRCQEITMPLTMFKLGTCCPGPVVIPEAVIMSSMLTTGGA